MVFLAAIFLAQTMIRKSEDEKLASYGYFWLLISFLWFFASLRLFFAWRENELFDRGLFIADQFFVFSSSIPLACYVLAEFNIKKTVTSIIMILYAFASLAGFGIILYQGVRLYEKSYFITKYMIPSLSIYIYIGLVLPATIGIFLIMIRATRDIIKKREVKIFSFIAPASLLLFLIMGSVDEMGLIGDWKLVFFRLLYVVLILVAYIVFDKEQAASKFIFQNND